MRSESCTASVMLWVISSVVCFEVLLDLQHLVAEQQPGLLVERGERLVHQQDLGLGGERAGDGDALAHAAGEFAGIAVLEPGEPDQRDEMPARSSSARGLADAGDLQREGDVVDHGAPREGRFLLEHHADRGVRPAHGFAGHPDAAADSRRAGRR